jgi:two-component system C4-dicarboxylate transport sensor histidine kinase DctB
MKSRLKKVLYWSGALALIGGSALLLQHIWKEQGLRSLQEINTQRVQLVTNALYAEVNRQDHLPLLLSLDSDLRTFLRSPEPPPREPFGRKLERISLEADTRALYVVRPDGTVVASDDWQSENTLVGRNVADRPYFKRAVETGKSADLDIESETGRVRYFLAEAVRDPELIGVVVVRIEFDMLENAWQRAGERVIVTERNGIAFLASDPAYRYRLMKHTGRPDTAGAVPEFYRGVGAQPISWDVVEQRGRAAVIRFRNEIDGNAYLYESMALPEYGWTVHRLAELGTVDNDQRDGAIIGGAISALILSLLLYLLQRHRMYLAARAAGIQLKWEVDERTRELREANSSLQGEVDERRRTEAQLLSTQNELVQAGKLAALGQMLATLAHEINQPLAAIQTFIASTKIFAKRGDTPQVSRNIDLISDLADRMASLAAHLKTFARKSEPGHREPVQISRAVEGALFLVDSRLRSGAVQVEKEIEPNLLVMGHAVQLEQVLVNVLLNAIDAITGVANSTIKIGVKSINDMVVISIADNGPGIPDDVKDRIFDPFVTTKPVGKGLGLGLSISYGIVQDFHGRIYAANLPDGGAKVTVELPRLTQAARLVAEASHV